MKNIMFILLALSLGFTANAQTKKDRDNYEIQVDGLGCAFCAFGLEKRFKEFKRIKNIEIDLETGIFTFTYPATEPLTLEQVSNQVENAGYTAVTTKISRWDGKEESLVGKKPDVEEELEVIEN